MLERSTRRNLAAFVAFTVATASFVVIAAQAQGPMPAPPPPVDLQKWQDQQDMTWADYHPIPNTKWADPAGMPTRVLRVALMAIDFEDQPFVITLPKKSDPFGNPQIDPVKREDVSRFYASFYGTPGVNNHGHTIHEYWMEQSRGGVGIPKIDAFGPYRMPKKLFQYGLNEYGQAGACPTGYTCDGRMEPDADALWAADKGAATKGNYDIVIRIYAGYDETSVWQEFGEMKFATKEDVPAAWGNPDTTKPRWVTTRYVPWTSWLAGAQQWGLSSVRQGESSGTITHEIAHHAYGIGDNNNNPYATPYHRVGSGPWDVMDRGSFNGPGGYHKRWVVPAAEGAAMPAGFTLRSRLLNKFITPQQVLMLSRDGLATSGLAVGTIIARAVDPGTNGVAGIKVSLDGVAPQDKTAACDPNTDPLCSGVGFNDYTIEVVQRIGYDSFTPDNGVLISKNKDRPSNSCGYGCFTWTIDANTKDLRKVDFIRPNGEPVLRTVADARQLNDALFHAGLRSGTAFEWEDTSNRLHFYVIDMKTDATGILSYTVGVRSLDGAGPQARGVSATAPATFDATTPSANFTAVLKNTGAAGTGAAFASDIYRVTLAVEGAGWAGDLQTAVVAVKAGESVNVPVYTRHSSGAAATATIVVTAVSESDPTKTSSATTTVKK